MPSSRRSGIDYSPAFGASIFRSKSEIESDLAVLERDAVEESADPSITATDDSPMDEHAVPETPPTSSSLLSDDASKLARQLDSPPASKPARKRASMQESKVGGKPASGAAHLEVISLTLTADAVAQIRQTVKAPGREVSYVRLTPTEKEQMMEVVYAFRRRGQKITETEISRLALNCLLADHERHGEESMLSRLIDSLHS